MNAPLEINIQKSATVTTVNMPSVSIGVPGPVGPPAAPFATDAEAAAGVRTDVTMSPHTTRVALTSTDGVLINIQNYGALGNAVIASNGSVTSGADDTAALLAAIAAATAANVAGLSVMFYFPPGNYSFNSLAMTTNVFPTFSNLTISGAGRDSVRIVWNDDDGDRNFFGGPVSGRASNVTIQDLSIRGSQDRRGNRGSGTGTYPFLVRNVDGLTIQRCRSGHSRMSGIITRACTDVNVRGCEVYRQGRDGIGVGNCTRFTITDNYVHHGDDDGISASTETSQPESTSNLGLITNNRLFLTQGIRVHSQQHFVIANNTLDCIIGHGIDIGCVAPSPGLIESMAPPMWGVIEGNKITNIFNRNAIDGLINYHWGILIQGAVARAGTEPAVPGEHDTASASIVPLYPYVTSNSASTTIPTPGARGITIKGNIVRRTLEPGVPFTSYGRGPIYLRGGAYDPTFTLADMTGPATYLASGIVNKVTITENDLGGMQTALTIGTGTRYAGIEFSRNRIEDMTLHGVLAQSAAIVSLHILDNEFDIDPFHLHPNRGPDGTWLSSATPFRPTAIYTGFQSPGMVVRGNRIRNCLQAIDQTSYAKLRWAENYIEAEPVIFDVFSTSNKGVGLVQSSHKLLRINSSPGSAAYGNITGSFDNLILPHSIVFNGGANDASNSWIWRSAPGSGLSGTVTPGPDNYVSPLHFIISPDTAVMTANASFDYMHVHANVNAGHIGPRGGITTAIHVLGTPAAPPAAGTGFVGLRSIVAAGANLLGTGGPDIANWIGSSFGGNSNVFSTSGATNMGVFTSWEFDTTLVAGSSAARKSGILIAKGTGDAVRGNFSDAAIQIADNNGATGWRHGILFGAHSSAWPLANDSTMIGAMTRQVGTPVSTAALYGIDFSNVTFTAGGAGLVMPLVTPISETATGKLGSIVWDTNYLHVCTAANTWKRVPLSGWAGSDYLTGITPGTVTASKAVVVDASKDIATLRHVSVNNLELTGNITYAGASSALNSKIKSETFMVGTATADGTMLSPHRFLISDIVDAGDSTKNLQYMQIKAGVGGPNAPSTATTSGARHGLLVEVSQVGEWKAGQYPSVIGSQIAGWGNWFSGADGAGVVNFGDYQGSVFGFNPTANVTKVGAKWALVNPMEINVQVHLGVEAASKFGMTIIQTGLDAVRGKFDDAAIMISNQSTSDTTWRNGICFGNYGNKWPFNTDSTIIRAQVAATGASVGAPATALYGLDFSALTVTAGGAGVVMPLITPASETATGKQGSLVWDDKNLYVCTATNTWKHAALTKAPTRINVHDFGTNVGTGGDDSAAIDAAVAYSNSLASANTFPPPIYFPAGIYTLGSAASIRTFVKGGGVVGDGQTRTYIKVLPTYVGDVFSWSEAWYATDWPLQSPTTPANLSATKLGPHASGFSIVGDLSAPTVQNGLCLYDRCSKALFRDVQVQYLTGRALYFGQSKFQTAPHRGSTTESDFYNIHVGCCGVTVPAVEITCRGDSGSQSTDALQFINLNIFAPMGGGGLVIRNANTSPMPIGMLKFYGLRIEGILSPSPAINGDLLTIGDPAMPGKIANVFISEFVGVQAPAGYAAIRLTADSAANAPYSIHVSGRIGPCPGKGIVVDFGRAARFAIRDMATTETNVTVSANAGSGIILDGNGGEATWTTNINSAAQVSIRYPLLASPFSGVGLSLNIPDSAATGGNARGTGAVDLQTSRTSATQVASGIASGILAGVSNLVSGANSAAIAGATNIVSGTRSVSLGGLRGNDRGRYGCVVQSGNFFSGSQGEAQGCDFVLQALTAADATPVRLTGSGSVADATNIINIPGISVYSLVINLLAVDRTNRANYYSWHLPQAILSRTGAVGTTAVTLGTPTIITGGTTTGAAVTLTADTTLGGINLSFTPPTGNAAAWGVVARIYTTEVA